MKRSNGLGGVGLVGGGVIVVIAIAFVAGVGGLFVRGSETDGGSQPASRAAEVPDTTSSTTRAGGEELGDSTVLRLAATASGAPPGATPVVDELHDGDVLRVRVTDLGPGARGGVRQCLRTASGVAGCTNDFPVQVGSDGVAHFQYQLREASRRCGAGASCVVVVSDDDNRVALAYTVFGAAAPPPASVVLHPPGPYEPGERIEVRVEPVPPGTDVGLAFCTPECSAAGTATATADRAGTARASIVLASGCGRGDRCSVVATGLVTRDAVARVRFVGGPTARYEAWRLAIGLGIAALLLLGARWIVRRTDWEVPSEAATPALDRATL